MIKYGKSLKDILKIKQEFIKENEKNLADRDRVGKIYLEQPSREECLLCGEKTPDKVDFVSHDIEYFVCPKCGHVQGRKLETPSFAEKIYVQDDYGKEYKEKDFMDYFERVKQIYKPKADFLVESLGCNRKVLDIGAGSGYFVMAALEKGVDISGVEISLQQVELGNQMLGSAGYSGKLKCISSETLAEELQSTDCEIISAIGVLEHLTNLPEILDVISKNEKIQYLYFSVPMMSVSVLLESVTPSIFNRCLGGAHTHVFTNKSIEYMCNQYGWKSKDAWRFGTDMMDLYRSLSVMLEKNEYFRSCINNNLELFDEMQLLLDKYSVSSEIHMILEKKGRE